MNCEKYRKSEFSGNPKRRSCTVTQCLFRHIFISQITADCGCERTTTNALSLQARLMSNAPTAVPHHAIASRARVTSIRLRDVTSQPQVLSLAGNLAVLPLHSCDGRQRSARCRRSGRRPGRPAASMRTRELAVTTQHMDIGSTGQLVVSIAESVVGA